MKRQQRFMRRQQKATTRVAYLVALLVLATSAFGASLASSTRSIIPSDVQQIICVDYRALRNSPSALALKARVLPDNIKEFEQSLRKLGFAVAEARVGRVVDVEVEATSADEARERVEAMCTQLLANPLIESYEVEVHG